MMSRLIRRNSLVLMASLGTAISMTFAYAGGGDVYTFVIAIVRWVFALGVALILWYVAQNADTWRNWARTLLPLLPFVSAVLEDINTSVIFSSGNIEVGQAVAVVIFSIESAVLLFVGASLGADTRRSLATTSVTSDSSVTSVTPTPAPISFVNEDPYDELGRDNQAHDRVTRTLIYRTREADATARFSLIVMVGLVLVGGGASVGLWLIDDLDQIRTMQIERDRLIGMSSELDTLSGQVQAWIHAGRSSGDSLAAQMVQQLREVSTALSSMDEGENNLERLADNVERNRSTNWPDIVNRATIAVLTLFLVQIFFAVHKYSRQLASVLAAKAEALELIGEAADDRALLRKEMVGVVKEALPGFGSVPRTPLQEMVRLVEATSKKARGSE